MHCRAVLFSRGREDDTATVRMLVTPRVYHQLRVQRKGAQPLALGWTTAPDTVDEACRMLLVHQIGSVRVGEVVRRVTLDGAAELCAD